MVPPGSAHVDAVVTGACPNSQVVTVGLGAMYSTVLLDFVARSTGVSDLRPSILEAFPYGIEPWAHSTVIERYLRLNCLTEAYASLWEEIMGEKWGVDTPLRKDEERRAAQVEIDAIVALSLGVTAEELCMIYRTQFPVMRRYDQEDRFDANGRKVPKEILKADAKLKDGAQLSEAERTWTHPQSGVEYVYEYPFRQLDREADMREAYARFEGVVG